MPRGSTWRIACLALTLASSAVAVTVCVNPGGTGGYVADIQDAVAGRAKIFDSTISGNVSPGVYVVNRARLDFDHSTIAANGTTQPSCCGTPVPPTAGGIWVSDDRVTVSLRSTIVSNATSDCAARSGAVNVWFPSKGFNVLQTSSCDATPKTTDIVGVDPLLEPLADNGGGSRTHGLQTGSPALGLIPTRGRCREPDQRGVLRTAPCDSGAFEAP